MASRCSRAILVEVRQGCIILAFCNLCNSTPHSQYHEFEQAWLDGVVTRGPKWRGWIKRAKQHAILQRANHVVIHSWHGQHYDDLIHQGISLPALHVSLETDGPSTELQVCGPCRQVFKSFTAWSTHAHKKHGRIDFLRRFLPDSRCRCCGGDYITRRRLLAHLHRSTFCAQNHVALTPEGLVLPGRNSTAEDLGPPRPVPIRRPRQQFYLVADEAEDFVKIQRAFSDSDFAVALHGFLAGCSLDPDGIAEGVRQLLLGSVVSISAAWDCIVKEHNDGSWDATITAGLLMVINNWSLRWWFQDEFEQVTWPKDCYDTTSVSAAKANVFLSVGRAHRAKCVPKIFTPVARPRSHELLVIHFYSGTRRDGDIQFWLEQAGGPPGTILTALSVDILFHDVLGDLSLATTQRRWLTFVADSDVVAIYVGPPCSTWSVSRWRFYTEQDQGPRPIRTLEAPFGIDSCRLSEIKDLLLGNTLLFFALSVLAVQASLCRIGVLEHPAPKDRSFFPCVWELPAFCFLFGFENFTECTIWQGLFGAISPKPTNLGISGAISPLSTLRAFETTSVLPPPLVMGKDPGSKSQSGAGYATSALKEYPPALCRGLAQLAIDWMTSHCTEVDVTPARNIDRSLLEPFMVNLTGLFERGADTRGGRAAA